MSAESTGDTTPAMSAGPSDTPRKRLFSRQILAESLAVFIIGVTLMHFFYAGKGGVLGDELGVPGHDSFYHLKMAAIIRESSRLYIFDPGTIDAKRHLVLALAGGGTGVAANALAIVDDETVVHKDDLL